jgi:hypothetical protein
MVIRVIRVIRVLGFLVFAMVVAPSRANAQTPPSPPPAEPALHHVPLVVAQEHTPLNVLATIDRPDLVHRAELVYRHDGRVDRVPFERSASASMPYIAVVPEEHVGRPSIAYAIELEGIDGKVVPAFASRDAMQPVEVVGDFVDAREEALLARLRGRRFVTETSGEYASFGTTPTRVSGSVSDSYWHIEAGFTYRLLRTVSEFGIRGGVYRGTSAVPGVTDPDQFNVGLNYGAPWLRIRATDGVHIELETLTSINEIGFALGGGGALLFGDPYASHLTLGFEGASVFGTRGYSRLDVMVSERLRIAPIVEVTNQPHASRAGVRLLMDVGIDLGRGWLVTARGGYQARSFESGGPSFGGGVRYAF